MTTLNFNVLNTDTLITILEDLKSRPHTEGTYASDAIIAIDKILESRDYGGIPS